MLMKHIALSISLVVTSLVASATYLYSSHNTSSVLVAAEVEEVKTDTNQNISIPKNLSTNQHKLMSIAYDIAKQDGHKNPEIIQALLLQETHAGAMKSFRVANPGKDAYFGLLQIKVGAARDVLKKHPHLWEKYDFHTKSDDEIKANLILNDYFNLEIGSKYLLLLKNQYGFSGRRLMNAYNRGPTGVKRVDDTYHYAIGAEKKLAQYKATKLSDI